MKKNYKIEYVYTEDTSETKNYSSIPVGKYEDPRDVFRQFMKRNYPNLGAFLITNVTEAPQERW